jgi:hypothetical protein
VPSNIEKSISKAAYMNQESKPDTEDIDEISFRTFSIFAVRIVIALALFAFSCAAQVSAPKGNGISHDTAALNVITAQTKVVASVARPRANVLQAKILGRAVSTFLTCAATRAQEKSKEQKPIPKWLHATSFATALGDISTTAYAKVLYPGPFWREGNPITRPLVSKSNAIWVPIAVGLTIGENLLADRMNRSPVFHRFARPLLVLQSAGAVTGTIWTVRGTFLQGLIPHTPRTTVYLPNMRSQQFERF